jgi:catechol 2,3-dioxygenase-like lactoylglutathione lyase family enzyme
MDEPILQPKLLCQVAIIVNDIEAVSRAWSRVLGVKVPPWHLTDPAEESHISYRGESTPGRAKLAFFDLGQVRLELIEPVDGPSTWREFLDAHGQGIHHVAFMVQGMDDVLARLEGVGGSTVQRGDYTGGRYAYVDAVAGLGAVLELLENLK